MILKQKKVAHIVAATGAARTDAVIKKIQWYTAVIPIIVPNPVAVCTDMITLAVSIAKPITGNTITIKSPQKQTEPQSYISLRLHLFYEVIYVYDLFPGFDGILHCLVSTTGCLFYIAD